MSCDLKQMDAEQLLLGQPQGSVDLVFGSPPYSDARRYMEAGIDLGIARAVREWVRWMVRIYHAAQWACRGLVAFVVGGGRTGNFRWDAAPALLMAALHAEGFCLRSPLIYHRHGIFGSGGPDWMRPDHEYIVCTTRPGRLPWSDPTACGRPPKYKPGGDPSHRTKSDGRVRGRKYRPPALANPGSVVHCKVGGGHMGHALAHENEAPFPLALAEFMVKSFCPPNGLVCDPFCGSATSAHAAIINGRNFIGGDLRASQVELGWRRIADLAMTEVSK